MDYCVSSRIIVNRFPHRGILQIQVSAFKNSAITVCSVAFFTKANSVRCFGGDGTHKVPGSSPRDLADEYEAIIKKERVCELGC